MSTLKSLTPIAAMLALSVTTNTFAETASTTSLDKTSMANMPEGKCGGKMAKPAPKLTTKDNKEANCGSKKLHKEGKCGKAHDEGNCGHGKKEKVEKTEVIKATDVK